MQNKRIAITGGIATGKSTAARYLKALGFPVIEADAVAREALTPGADPYRAVTEEFGKDILTEDGQIHRARLAQRIFSDEKARKKLNAITHPWIRARMEELGGRENAPVVFFDIPLYFESESPLPVDAVWLIDADEEVQLKRLMARDTIDRAYALQKIRAQMPMEEKRKRADVILRNNGTEEELRQALDKMLEEEGGGTPCTRSKNSE